MIPLSDENPTVRPAVITILILAAMAAVWVIVEGAGFGGRMVRAICHLGLVPGELPGLAPIGSAVPIGPGLYYTDVVGGGIGSALIMTGGGSGANVGSSRNDDGFSGPISLGSNGFTLNFFGSNYTTFFANNNGNISFGAGVSTFTPAGIL